MSPRTKQKAPAKKKVLVAATQAKALAPGSAQKTLAAKGKLSCPPPKVYQRVAKTKNGKVWWKEFNPTMHILIAVFAWGVLYTLGSVDRNFATQRSAAVSRTAQVQSIRVKHDASLTLHVVLARKNSLGYLSLANESPFSATIDLPADWRRVEVSGAPLTAFISTKSQGSAVRWTVPPFSGMKLTMTVVPDQFAFFNASPTVMEVKVWTVELPAFKVRTNVMLIQEETRIKLWEDDE